MGGLGGSVGLKGWWEGRPGLRGAEGRGSPSRGSSGVSALGRSCRRPPVRCAAAQLWALSACCSGVGWGGAERAEWPRASSHLTCRGRSYLGRWHSSAGATRKLLAREIQARGHPTSDARADREGGTCEPVRPAHWCGSRRQLLLGAGQPVRTWGGVGGPCVHGGRGALHWAWAWLG